MCIFATNDSQYSTGVRVSGTRIYAAVSGNRQLTVYQMTSQPEGEVEYALILPIPIQGDLEFHDMSHFPDFFEKLDSLFSSKYTRGGCKGWGIESDMLEVYKSGGYDVSFAANLADLDRVNPAHFLLSPGLKEALVDYEESGWGFIVAQLREGELAQPLAFSYDILEGDYQDLTLVNLKDYHGTGKVEDYATYDHTIYIQNCKFDEGTARQISPEVVTYRRFSGGSDSLLDDALMYGPLVKIEYSGSKVNRDVFFHPKLV